MTDDVVVFGGVLLFYAYRVDAVHVKCGTAIKDGKFGTVDLNEAVVDLPQLKLSQSQVLSEGNSANFTSGVDLIETGMKIDLPIDGGESTSDEAHFVSILKHLQNELSLAQNNVKIAVSWFTNYALFKQIKKLAQGGIRIQLIINNAPEITVNKYEINIF